MRHNEFSMSPYLPTGPRRDPTIHRALATTKSNRSQAQPPSPIISIPEQRVPAATANYEVLP
jgi:hypothetical protein